jgi:tRNA(Arg) A34 adenosine deaminase TadA
MYCIMPQARGWLTCRQGEMAALEHAGRLRAQDYKGATMYTTLSPCDMCTGACILYKVKRVVIGFVGRVLKGF